MRSILFLFVMCLTEVAWTEGEGKHFKLAPEDEFQLMWGTTEAWQFKSKIDDMNERQPDSDKPKVPRRESWIR